MADAVGVVVPHTQLSPEALRGLAEEFVTRDGTDYGQVERTLEQKVAAVLRLLDHGAAVILYDNGRASATIVTREWLEAWGAMPRGSRDSPPDAVAKAGKAADNK